MRCGLWVVSELALERVTRVVGEDGVPRECGVGKLCPHVHRTCIQQVVCGLRPEEGSRAMARHEDAVLHMKPPMAMTTLDVPRWMRKCLYSLAYYQ